MLSRSAASAVSINVASRRAGPSRTASVALTDRQRAYRRPGRSRLDD
jgi:hypothetical protein